jgi:3-hydroxyisobutyrate dehydrogenase-like beta-hydroxyacid dehydrogenase
VYLSYNLAFAHGLQLGQKLDLSDNIVMDLLTKGAAAHPLINDRLPSALRSDFNEGFLLKRCLKDLDFLELTAGYEGTAVEAYQRLRSEIRKAVKEGLGDRDILVLSQTRII